MLDAGSQMPGLSAVVFLAAEARPNDVQSGFSEGSNGGG